jgi:undecaprenyl-diphosphatase
VANPPFVLAMKAVSRAGSGPHDWAAAIVVIGWLFYRDRTAAPRAALLIVVALGGSQGLNVTVKDLTGRVRPALSDPVAHAGGLSFPSGHAQTAAVGFGQLVLLLWPTLGRRGRGWLVAAALLAVLTIGFSGVALGALTIAFGGGTCPSFPSFPSFPLPPKRTVE